MEDVLEDEKDLFDVTLDYIACGSDPQAAEYKCAIRKRAKKYRVQDGQLHRVVCRKSKNLRKPTLIYGLAKKLTI